MRNINIFNLNYNNLLTFSYEFTILWDVLKDKSLPYWPNEIKWNHASVHMTFYFSSNFLLCSVLAANPVDFVVMVFSLRIFEIGLIIFGFSIGSIHLSSSYQGSVDKAT